MTDAKGMTGARRPWSELGLRTLSSLALGALAIAAVFLGGWALAAFWLAAGIAFGLEWIAMAGVRPRLPVQVALVLGLAGAVLALLLGLPSFAGPAILLAALAALALAREGRVWAASGLLYAAAVAIVPLLVWGHRSGGPAGLLWMFAVVWSTDIAAYFTGRAIGGPKLWPAVSPGKTWSGAAGGTLAAVGAGLACAVLAGRAGSPLPGDLLLVAAASLAASVASQAGDLAESAMKRRFGVKDSGRLIPGHGGVMDRLDGFAAVALLLGLLFGASYLTGAAGRA